VSRLERDCKQILSDVEIIDGVSLNRTIPNRSLPIAEILAGETHAPTPLAADQR